MKSHKTIEITLEFLEQNGACACGIEWAGAFLPTKISTDPEANIKLAIEIAEDVRAGRSVGANVWWLTSITSPAPYGLDTGRGWPAGYNFDNPLRNPEADAFVVAQYLAWAADALLTKQGK